MLQVYWVVGFSPTVRFLMFWLQLFLINLWSIGLFQVGGQFPCPTPSSVLPCISAGQAGPAASQAGQAFVQLTLPLALPATAPATAATASTAAADCGRVQG